MFSSVRAVEISPLDLQSRFSLSSGVFAVGAFLAELTAAVAMSVVSGIAYHIVAYGEPGEIENFIHVGGLAGLAYALTFLMRDEYALENLLEGRRTAARTFLVWNLAFVALAVVGFLTKSTGMFSRGFLVTFYIAGLATVCVTNAGLYRGLAFLVARGLVTRRRLMLVGTAADLVQMERAMAGNGSAAVAARLLIPDVGWTSDENAEHVQSAVGNARALRVDDVVFAPSLSRTPLIETAIAAFSVLPVAIHLGADAMIGQFRDARIGRFGAQTTLSLTRQPLTRFDAMMKRTMDIAAASVALIFLAPLFALIALAIKLDGKGPVFFLQRRRGFNLAEFAIWKFRTMTTLDDGDVVRQATANDARVTGIGYYLRKYSLDELPQLINVLSGEMSLVGPRPHAVAHDRFFEQRIAMYPRRLKMKPGITGWAQVNGYRGATETDDAMRQRIEHDIHYIDNWSILFDFYIILLTLVSPKAQRNAL